MPQLIYQAWWSLPAGGTYISLGYKLSIMPERTVCFFPLTIWDAIHTTLVFSKKGLYFRILTRCVMTAYLVYQTAQVLTYIWLPR